MGATGSITREEPDPWWRTVHPQQHNEQNVLMEDRHTEVATRMEGTSHISTEVEEPWLQRIQELGRTVQQLAEENLRLMTAKQTMEEKHKEESQKDAERLECLEIEVKLLRSKVDEEKPDTLRVLEDYQTSIQRFQEEAIEHQKIVHGLQTRLNNNSNGEEMDRLREQMEENQMAMNRLQGDITENQITIDKLQTELKFSDEQRSHLENSCSKQTSEIEFLKLKEEGSQQEIKRLQLELIDGKQVQDQLLLDKERLVVELKNRGGTSSDEQSTIAAGLEEVAYEQGIEILQNEARGTSGSEEGTQASTTRIGSLRASEELEKFRAEMNSKREARQRALSAVSNEMERLRTELNSERTARKKAVQEVEELQRMAAIHDAVHSSDTSMPNEIEQLKKKLTLERTEKQKITQELLQLQRQGYKEIEQVLKELECEKERAQQILGEKKYTQAQLEESDQMLLQKSEEIIQLQTKLTADKEKYQQQVLALKEVITISKQMLSIREGQVGQLKQKLSEIETTVAERHHGSVTADLKAEYLSQMQNIKALKELYEERMNVMTAEREKLTQEHEDNSKKLENEIKKSSELETQTKDLETSVAERNATISSLQDQLSDSLDQSRNLSNELALINNMFTQILVGSSTTDMDLDKLTRLLQENHDLITEMTVKEDCSETAATLPKLLLDLITQANDEETDEERIDEKYEKSNDESTDYGSEVNGEKGNENNEISVNEATTSDTLTIHEEGVDSEQRGTYDDRTIDKTASVNVKVKCLSEDNEKCAESTENDNKINEENDNNLGVQDIASNLPKVWRVLMELISHHIVPTPSTDEDSNQSCYKSIDTPNGPRLVISVSQTFIRLKDLILEKKSLQKELTHLKQLNGHLESKLNQQERRLSLVSSELRKTWNVVGRMRTQHEQLHTHEKVLRYELQQKRKLLTELKQELEYCREKWERARQKNSESEVEWKKLRREFASRKKHPNDSFSNSGESGYSDEKGDDSAEEEDTGNKDTGQTELLHTDQSGQDTEAGESAFYEHCTVNIEPVEYIDSSRISTPTSSLPALLIATESFSERTGLGAQVATDTVVHHEDDSITSVPSVLEECPTISLVTLLKQELLCFSKNLEMNTSGIDSSESLRALQSIFSLPAIQIPECHAIKKEVNHSKSSTDVPKLSLNSEQSTENVHSSKLDTNTPPRENKELTTRDITCIVRPADALPSNHQECTDSIPQSSPTLKAMEVMDTEPGPAASSSRANRTPEEILEARAARLKRLEEQCQQLFNKVTRTTHRSVALSNRLEELHGQYGSTDMQDDTSSSNNIPRPPPLPNRLPTIRLPTHMERLSPMVRSTETLHENEQDTNLRISSSNAQQEEDTTEQSSAQQMSNPTNKHENES